MNKKEVTMENNNEVFYWNVYIPMKSLDKLEFEFYRNLYNYRLYCRNMKSKNSEYKSNPKYKELQNILNSSYEKIKNLAGVTKNADGEYDYPNAAYKKRVITNAHGKEETMFLICVNDAHMSKKFKLQDIVFYIPLFAYGNIKSLPVKGSKFEHVSIEENVGGLCRYFKENIKEISQYTQIDTCVELISWLQKFPTVALYEVNFGTILDKKDLEGFIPEVGEGKNIKKGA